MFLASFAWYTWVLTSFLRLEWGLVFFILSLVIGLIVIGVRFFFFSKKGNRFCLKNHILKLIVVQWWAFLLSGLALAVFLWKNHTQVLSDFFSFKPLQIETSSTFQNFLWEVLIEEQTKPDTYIVKTADNYRYFLKTAPHYEVWASLRLWASLKPIDRSKLYSELSLQSGFSLQNWLSYQFNYDKWLVMKGLQGTLYERFSLPVDQDQILISSFQQQLISTRTWIKEQVSTVLPWERGALLLGMLIGDKSQLSDQAYQNFILSGIVHIIAVSGGNLVMIIIFLSAVLFFLPFYLRNAVVILGVVAFALLCGGDSSVVRALVMAVLSLVALFRGREIQIWRLLKYAFVLMLCYNPFFLSYDLGFLLSFGAVIGIVLVSEAFNKQKEKADASPVGKTKKKIRIPFLFQFLKNYGLPTLGATLWTLPILLFFIGETNLTWVLINLLIVPLVPLVTIGGFISVLMTSWTGWTWVMMPIRWLLDLIFWASDLAVAWGVGFAITATWAKWFFVLLLLSIGGVLFQLLKKKKTE